MPSLKKIIYTIGNLTAGDDDKYTTIREICIAIDDDVDLRVTISRVSSTMKRYYNLLSKKGTGRGRTAYYKLSANGRNYLNKFRDSFDPVTDMSIFEQKIAEVI